MHRTLALVLAAALAAGCPKKPEPGPEVSDPVVAPATTPVRNVDEAVDRMVANFQRVHFDFDSSTLGATAQEALAANAKLMQKYPSIRVEIQGHADERGTTDYNLALGERRAHAVKKVLVGNGVSADRLTAMSFGEERPLASGSSEQAWSQNRRAEFRITWGEGASGTID